MVKEMQNENKINDFSGFCTKEKVVLKTVLKRFHHYYGCVFERLTKGLCQTCGCPYIFEYIGD